MRESDFSFKPSVLDDYLGRTLRSEIIEVKSAADLAGFTRMAENTNLLYRPAERDIWKMADDGSYIERLFDSEGAPLTLDPEVAGEAVDPVMAKTAAAEDYSELQAKELMASLVETYNGRVFTNKKIATAVVKADADKVFEVTEISDAVDPEAKYKVMKKTVELSKDQKFANLQDLVRNFKG